MPVGLSLTIQGRDEPTQLGNATSWSDKTCSPDSCVHLEGLFLVTPTGSGGKEVAYRTLTSHRISPALRYISFTGASAFRAANSAQVAESTP
jgi:hypothetical protein